MPPKKEKNKGLTGSTDEPSAKLPAPSTSGDQGPITRSQSPSSSDNELSCLRREIKNMAVDLHSKLDQVINNQQDLLTRMGKIEADHEEMEKSILFTNQSVEDLQAENKLLADGASKMAKQLHEATTNISKLQETSLQQERYSRSFNIRIGGIPEALNENHIVPFEKAMQTFATKFSMPDVTIENAHRTGRSPRYASDVTDKPRHILVKFLYRPERQKILKHAKRALANSPVFILEDLPAADIAKKRELRDIMKKAYQSGGRPVSR